MHRASDGKNRNKYGALAYRTNVDDSLTFTHNFCKTQGELEMLKLGLFVRLEAKPGKEQELASFLQQGLQLANQEATTPLWFALRIGPTTFAIFDAFNDEAGRQAHLNGPIAKALMANAPNLLSTAPSIERVDVLGAKLP
jgi:quinol monooxygenase YgiN